MVEEAIAGRLRGGVEAMTVLQALRIGRNALDHPVVNRPVRIEPRSRNANLSGIEEDGVRDARDREIEIGIGNLCANDFVYTLGRIDSITFM